MDVTKRLVIHVWHLLRAILHYLKIHIQGFLSFDMPLKLLVS